MPFSCVFSVHLPLLIAKERSSFITNMLPYRYNRVRIQVSQIYQHNNHLNIADFLSKRLYLICKDSAHVFVEHLEHKTEIYAAHLNCMSHQRNKPKRRSSTINSHHLFCALMQHLRLICHPLTDECYSL